MLSHTSLLAAHTQGTRLLKNEERHVLSITAMGRHGKSVTAGKANFHMRALTTGFINNTTGFAYSFKKGFMIHNESSIGLGFGLRRPRQSGLLLAAYLVFPRSIPLRGRCPAFDAAGWRVFLINEAIMYYLNTSFLFSSAKCLTLYANWLAVLVIGGGWCLVFLCVACQPMSTL